MKRVSPARVLQPLFSQRTRSRWVTPLNAMTMDSGHAEMLSESLAMEA